MSTTATMTTRRRRTTRRRPSTSPRPPVVAAAARAPTAIRVEATDRHWRAARLALVLREAAAVVLLGKLAT